MAMANWVERLIQRLDLVGAVERNDEAAVRQTLGTSALIGDIKQLAICGSKKHDWVIRLAQGRRREIIDAEKRLYEEQRKLPPIQRAISFPTFDNLASLRSGRDQFSRMKLDQLRQSYCQMLWTR